jgi:hypothetical protein
MSIKHRTGVERVLAALKLTGAAAMALSFIMMLVLAGCDTGGDDPGGGDGSFTVGAQDESVPSGGILRFYTSPYRRRLLVNHHRGLPFRNRYRRERQAHCGGRGDENQPGNKGNIQG